jgi:hypothetical protein
MAPFQFRRMQQNSAAENLHGIHPAVHPDTCFSTPVQQRRWTFN